MTYKQHYNNSYSNDSLKLLLKHSVDCKIEPVMFLGIEALSRVEN